MTTMIIGANASLLSWMIYRILRSRLAALIGGWLFLCPFYAQEATLWASASAYLVAAGLVLFSLHCFLTALFSKRATLSIVLGLLAVVISLFILEQPVVSLVSLPLLALCIGMQRKPRDYLRLAKNCGKLLGLIVCVIAIVFLFIYRSGQAPQVTARGGFVTNPVQILKKCCEFTQRLHWMILSQWGRGLTSDAFRLGVRVQLTNAFASSLLAIAIVCVSLLSAAWRPRKVEYDVPASIGFLLLTASIAGMLITMWFPGTLVQGQILEFRMLYIPGAFFTMAIAVTYWLLVKLLSGYRYENMVIALCGLATWASATCMIGYASAFSMRSRVDSIQLNAIKQILSVAPLPSDTTIICFGQEEGIGTDYRHISSLLVGVLETPWSAHTELSRLLCRRDFHVVITHRWSGMIFQPTVRNGAPPMLRINGTAIQTERSIIVVYQKKRAFVIKELIIELRDGPPCVFKFPIAEALSCRGAPAIAASADAEVPQSRLRIRAEACGQGALSGKHGE
jgi:hypothetical protein